MSRLRRNRALQRNRRASTRHNRVRRAGAAQAGARRSLRSFRQASFLAVAITAFILLILGLDDGAAATIQENGDEPGIAEDVAGEAVEAARQTFADLWQGLLANLPQVLVALLILLLAWGIVSLARPVLHRATRGLQKGPAVTAVFGIVVWLVGFGIAVSVIAGDLRALLGSIGLIGLALSWALQTPIESFTGWLMNSFKGYYRIGDRIAVGDVFGDVVSIDFLTTTVWEYGGMERQPNVVAAEQPTGRLITFPNNEVLAGSIINYTRDFPYVWDELAVPVAAESDLTYAREVIEKVAVDLLAEHMRGPAITYRRILERSRLPVDISERPQTFTRLTDAGVDIVVRYLVGARERRVWKSRLTDLVVTEVNREENRERIIPLYPRRQIQLVDKGGAPTDWVDPTS